MVIFRQDCHVGRRFEFLADGRLDGAVFLVARVALEFGPHGSLDRLALCNPAHSVVFQHQQRLPRRVRGVLVQVNRIGRHDTRFHPAPELRQDIFVHVVLVLRGGHECEVGMSMNTERERSAFALPPRHGRSV